MQLSARQALTALAQVFEDYPNARTKGTLARDLRNKSVPTNSPQAFRFCAIGFLHRLALEGAISGKARDVAMKALQDHCAKHYGMTAFGVNDTMRHDGAENDIIDAARGAAKDLETSEEWRDFY
jgi:hypothetical protein